MQVGIDVTCIHTNFGGCDIYGFGDIATFKNGQFSLSSIKSMVSFTLTSDIVAGVVIDSTMDEDALIIFDLSDCDYSNKYASSSISSSGVILEFHKQKGQARKLAQVSFIKYLYILVASIPPHMGLWWSASVP